MDLPTMVLELSRRLYDVERRVNNVIRIGRVTEVDNEKALLKVAYALDEQDQDVVTGWIPMSATRAGEINKWEPPSKDEQVILVNFSGEVGPMSTILSSLYSDKYKPPHDKGAEKKTTVRKNNDQDEPDDNLPAYISHYKANKDDGAVAYKSSRNKYKNPNKQVEASMGQDRNIVKASSGSVVNQHTQTPNSDVYSNPGGDMVRNCAAIAYGKQSGPKDNAGGTSFASAAIPTGDSFAGFDGGAMG